MPRAATALLVAALLLAACAATDTASPSPTVHASIPPGLEGIAGAYLDLADDFNAATCAFNAVLSQSAPALHDLTRGSAYYAISLQALAGGLSDIEWPAELEADAAALIEALAVNQEFAERMAAAETLPLFIEADNQLIASNATSAAAATRLRAHLGLGSAGDPCPG